MSAVSVSMKLTPKQAGALYMKNIALEKEINELKAQVEQLREKNGGLILDNHALSCMVHDLRFAIISNCYDDPSTSGKRLMELANKVPAQCLAEVKAQAVEQVSKHFKDNFNGSEKLTVRDICWMLDKYSNHLRQTAKGGVMNNDRDCAHGRQLGKCDN